MEKSELLELKMKSSEAYKRSMLMAPSSQESSDDGGSGNFHVVSSVSSRGKDSFTASQVQEFQRQSIICKYIMASMPVPPQLLLPLPTHPQSNSLDLKFSSGSNPEPWRCKRTDGKKWRCSRDVAPDQKYCERHAHKSKPRSRKPVEIHTNRHPPKSNTNHHHDQTRCIEWLGRADRSGVQQLNTDQNRRNSPPSFQVQEEYPMNFNQYMSSGEALGSQLTTRESKDDGITNNASFTSLTLSMSGWNHDANQRTIGMLDSETSCDEVLRSHTQWGGPLAEALCLGNASTGYSNSTPTSSCTFGSCDNGLDFIG